MRSATEILGIPPLARRAQRREVVSTTRQQFIGNDFVFARYVETREGFYAQPIKRMRFEPGGRVVHETGRRECWMPYQDGIALYAEGDRYELEFGF